MEQPSCGRAAATSHKAEEMVATDLLEAPLQSAGPDSDGAEGPSDGGGRDQLSSAVQHQPNDNDARDSQVRLRLLAPEVTKVLTKLHLIPFLVRSTKNTSTHFNECVCN